MEVYAAQIDRMDRGVGRIVAALEAAGKLDDTLILFLSDNGGSDEDLPLVELERFKQRRDILRVRTRDGREVRIGNEPSILPGPEDSYASYGRAWANLSNTPFRYYKRWVHEGGISTPLVVHWPNGALVRGSVVRAPQQLTDVMPTIVEATGASYPARHRGRDVHPMEGQSLMRVLRGGTAGERTLYWEHTGNAAIRRGRWKLVRDYPKPWELYDIAVDRTELDDLAAQHPDVVAGLARDWQAWADRVGVIPFDETIRLYADQGKLPREAMG
jgi:arylsulfatase